MFDAGQGESPGRYAERWVQAFATAPPLLWPRRSAGEALRIAYLVAPGRRIAIGDLTIDVDAYLAHVVAAHSRERFASMVLVVDGPLPAVPALSQAAIPVVMLGHAPDPALARSLAEADCDALIDLAGMAAATGPLLAQRPARTVWTYPQLAGAQVAPLITHALPALSASDASTLAAHRLALEAALIAACAGAPWFTRRSGLAPSAMAAKWRDAVAAHQGGDPNAAVIGYRAVLAEQPGYAPAHYLFGMLLRDRGQADEAESQLAAAVAAAPAYADARSALANLLRTAGRLDAAADTCREGLALTPAAVSLWRALGLAELARQDGEAARAAFEKAADLVPGDPETLYNEGVALQMLARPEEALQAYQRALAIDSELIAAEFNIGVILHDQGHFDAAAEAFEHVLSRSRAHVAGHKALSDALLAARRIDDWLLAFDRFEEQCPRALAVAVRALRAYQYRGDFDGLDRYLERLRRQDFVPEDDADLVDGLEQLLFLLLYFDTAPETQLEFYRAYDAVARRVYGPPLPRPVARRPGRLRIGYLSGDLRNHVMGKMMWAAVRHHDRNRFELYFYSTVAESDEWTERFRGLAQQYRVVAGLTDRGAALAMAEDDLDLLVDLSAHTKGARPGILAARPARVQMTHIANSGALGLAAIDFKLTDAYADLPENQAFYLETLWPMAGCVYPYRHIEPAAIHAFHRDWLGIPADTVVLGAFVNAIKLSRRCLALWREVLERIPSAVLAISPQSPEMHGVYGQLLPLGGIPPERVMILPQGRNDAENQARYHVVDFVLDPVPYCGVNGTLEALDMGVPVVTLCGRKHSERTSYSMLTNLGVTDTIARDAGEYVDIAARLATDREFAARVRAAIRSGLAGSPLTDMAAHTRNLERAYIEALRRNCPEALADSGDG